MTRYTPAHCQLLLIRTANCQRAVVTTSLNCADSAIAYNTYTDIKLNNTTITPRRQACFLYSCPLRYGEERHFPPQPDLHSGLLLTAAKMWPMDLRYTSRLSFTFTHVRRTPRCTVTKSPFTTPVVPRVNEVSCNLIEFRLTKV